MGLETGTGIGDLVPTNPLSTDAVSAGDDHIRLIKTVMQSVTFLKSVQTFTASGTWTRPANVKRILVYCLGGGGGGGGTSPAGYSGGGGGGGATAIAWVDVSAIASATVTIGAGGAGGAVGGNAGSPGGITEFSSAGPTQHCAAREGLPGPAYHLGGDSNDVSLSIGNIKFPGGYGSFGDAPGAAVVFGSHGGGNGGANGGSAKPNSGGGGGGGQAATGSGQAGGNGGSGYCIVFEFGW